MVDERGHPGRPPRIRLRLALALTVALTTGVAVGIFARGTGQGPGRGASDSSSRPLARIDLGARPIRRPVAAYGAFWSIAQDAGAGKLILARVDYRSLRSSSVAGLGTPEAIASGFGSIWVATCPSQAAEGNCRDGEVVRLDPAGDLKARIPVGGYLYPIAAGEGSVFVGRHTKSESSVVRIDPATNEVLSTTNLGNLPPSARCCVQDMAAAEGAVWLMTGQQLGRLDPRSLEATATDVRGDLITAGAGAVWVNTSILGPAHILRVDPTNGRSVVAIPGPGFTYPAIGDGRVWLAVSAGGPDAHPSIVLYRIDPQTNAIERVFALPVGPAKASRQGLGGPVESVVVDRGTIWVTDELAFQAIRIEPLALEHPTPSPPIRPPTVTRTYLGAIPVGRPIDFGALWTVVQNPKDGSLHLLRIDRDKDTVLRVPLGRAHPKFLAAFDDLWIGGCPHQEPSTNCLDGTVYRVDPTTSRVTGQVRVGHNITALTATEEAVWVGQWTYVNNSPQPPALLRIDPETLAVRRFSLESLRTKGPPCCIHMLAADRQAVWMLLGDESQVVRMDTNTGRFTRIEAYGSQIASDGSAVWLNGRTEPHRKSVDHVFRIDSQTSQVVGPGPAATSVIVNDGSVWALQASVLASDRALTLQSLDPITGQSVGQPVTVEAQPPKVNIDVPFSWTVHAAYGYWGGEAWITVGDSLEAIRIDFAN